MWVPPKEMRNGPGARPRLSRPVKVEVKKAPPALASPAPDKRSDAFAFFSKPSCPCRTQDNEDERKARAGSTMSLVKAIASEDAEQLATALEADFAEMAPEPLRMRAEATLRLIETMKEGDAASLMKAREDAEATGVQQGLLLKAERLEANARFQNALAPGDDEAKKKALAQLEADRKMLLADLEELDDGNAGKELIERWLVEVHREMVRLRLELYPRRLAAETTPLALDNRPSEDTPRKDEGSEATDTTPLARDNRPSEDTPRKDEGSRGVEAEGVSDVRSEEVGRSKWQDVNIPVGPFGVLTISVQSFLEHEKVQAASLPAQNWLSQVQDSVQARFHKIGDSVHSALQKVQSLDTQFASAMENLDSVIEEVDPMLLDASLQNSSPGDKARDQVEGPEVEGDVNPHLSVAEHSQGSREPKKLHAAVHKLHAAAKLGPSNGEWLSKDHIHAAPPRPKPRARSTLDSPKTPATAEASSRAGTPVSREAPVSTAALEPAEAPAPAETSVLSQAPSLAEAPASTETPRSAETPAPAKTPAPTQAPAPAGAGVGLIPDPSE